MAAPEMRLERASAFCLSSVPFCSLLFQPEREHHGARGLSRFSRCNRERKSYRAGICYERVSFSLISLKSYEPSGICKCDNKGHSWTILDTIFILSVQLLPVFIILYSYCHCTVCSVLVKKKKNRGRHWNSLDWTETCTRYVIYNWGIVISETRRSDYCKEYISQKHFALI